jgi:hypothetical protein
MAASSSHKNGRRPSDLEAHEPVSDCGRSRAVPCQMRRERPLEALLGIVDFPVPSREPLVVAGQRHDLARVDSLSGIDQVLAEHFDGRVPMRWTQRKRFQARWLIDIGHDAIGFWAACEDWCRGAKGRVLAQSVERAVAANGVFELRAAIDFRSVPFERRTNREEAFHLAVTAYLQQPRGRS